MKILQLCYKPPYPPIDGGSMGMHSLTIGLLNNNHKVKVIAFNSYKHPCRVEDLPKDYVKNTGFETIPIDLKANAFDAIICLLKNKSYIANRFFNTEMSNKLKNLLREEEFDFIQFESVFLASYIPIIKKYSKAKLVLRAPNVEHLIWERTAQNTKNPIKKLYIKHLATTLKDFELREINNFDGVYPVTKVDEDYFIQNGLNKPCKGVPVGIEKADIIDDQEVEENSIFHIGSMNWIPNEQGIKWFIDEVWDLAKAKTPKLKAYFAGRAMPNWLLDLEKKDIFIYGEVPDSVRFMTSKNIMVTPLLSGSGIRIKIIEAMSIGKCVIATSIAAEGILYENEKNIVIANSPEEFALAIEKCLKDKEFSAIIGRNAYKLIKEKYNTNAIANELVDLYTEL